MIRDGTYQGHPFRIAVAITILAVILLAGVASAEIIQVNISVENKTINLNSNEDIVVDILSTNGFDATKLDISSIRFETAEVKNHNNRDVNNDKILDLSLHFKLQNTDVQCGESLLVYLIGKTIDGQDIVGSDIVTIKGCAPLPPRISPPGAPNITSFDPPTQMVMNNASEPRTFSIQVNQTVDVIWYINGSPIQLNESVNESKYTNISTSSGIWNITAVAHNVNGTDIQYWDWIVNKANTTTTIPSDSPDPSIVGQPYTVNFTVNTLSSEIPTGNVIVSDGTDSCTASVAIGSCLMTSTTASEKTLTATYEGDNNFSSSSGTAMHQVYKANTTIEEAPQLILPYMDSQ